LTADLVFGSVHVVFLGTSALTLELGEKKVMPVWNSASECLAWTQSYLESPEDQMMYIIPIPYPKGLMETMQKAGADLIIFDLQEGADLRVVLGAVH